MELPELFLTNLTRRMLHLGWHAARLARQSGLSDASLSRILAGRQTNLTLDTVGRLATALGMTPASLLTPSPRPGLAGAEASGESGKDGASSEVPSTLQDFLRLRYGYSDAYAESLAQDLEAIRLARETVRRRRDHQPPAEPAVG